MKFLTVLLLLVSYNTFSQSGYYYFNSLGVLKDSNQRKEQMFVSYEFYAEDKPACSTIYTFLDINYPQFIYYLRNISSCEIHGPFASKEEAVKVRERDIERMRVNQFMVTGIIYGNRRTSDNSSSGSVPAR